MIRLSVLSGRHEEQDDAECYVVYRQRLSAPLVSGKLIPETGLSFPSPQIKAEDH